MLEQKRKKKLDFWRSVLLSLGGKETSPGIIAYKNHIYDCAKATCVRTCGGMRTGAWWGLMADGISPKRIAYVKRTGHW